MNAPDVSVVVRSVARPTLARALQSIALQQAVTLEVVLVGASGAGHPPPAPNAGAHPVRFIASVVPLARAQAANAGIDAAAGRWITWLDDDDEWLPGHLLGLLAAATANPRAGVVHSLADVRMSGEPPRPFGQPMALSELYQRNFLHASTALVARELVARGCRCDDTLDTHQDWDWFLQCAQHGPFHFVRQRTFVWHADVGSSGAGGGRNLDHRKTQAYTDRVRLKWAPRRDRLLESLAPVLEDARACCDRCDWIGAASAIRAAITLDPNNPDALAMMSVVERALGRMAGAQAAAALACVVRPDDAALVYNLALICRARGNVAKVRDCAERLARLVSRDARATALLAQLEGT